MEKFMRIFALLIMMVILSGFDNQWEGKQWLGFGTSITDVESMGKYPVFLSEMSGLEFTNKGISGGTLVDDILPLIKTTDLSRYSLITIEGFVNDWWESKPLGTVGTSDTSTFSGALLDAINYLQQNTIATVVIVTDHTGRNYNGFDESASALNGLGLTQHDYRRTAVETANYIGVPVVDAGSKSQINENTAHLYLIDQIHHSELGGHQFALTIWADLKDIMPRLVQGY